MELTPDFSVSINGQSNFPKDRVISIRTTDQAGFVSDSCEIELDDFDNALQFPNTEAKVIILLGYQEKGLTKIGTYYVREITFDGARRTIKIVANALPKSMRSQKTKTNDVKLNEYMSAIDSELNSELSADYEDIDLSDSPQFGESDINYLTRIANKVGAVAKPVDNHLIFSKDMSGKSVSGKSLPTKYIESSEVANYSCNFKETETGTNGATGTIYANWYDKKSGEYHLVHAGSGDPEIELNEIFSSEKDALAAVKSKGKRIEKNSKTFRFSTEGRPDLFAEGPIILRGFPIKIPTNWIISRVEHTLNSNGFVSNVECVGGK